VERAVTARRTTGDDGLPRHRADDFPAGLATETMLRAQRRRLTPGQRHVAWYGTPYGDRALYRIADSIELPPLVGKRAEAYKAARTCARCGTVHTQRLYDNPNFKGTHGRRLLDESCRTLEFKSLEAPEAYRERQAAVAWAAEVLADERTVVGHQRYQSGLTLPGRLHLATVAGEVLLDLETERPWSVLDAVTWLDSRRLVMWWGNTRRGDEMRLKVWDWAPSLKDSVSRDTDPRDAVAYMCDLLHLMAVDEHPDGPPGTCPVLPETGIVPCGQPLTETGHCVEHRRDYLVQVLAAGGQAPS
jgi:hypothetical protein